MHAVAKKGIGNIVPIHHFRKQKELMLSWHEAMAKFPCVPASSRNPSTHCNIIGRSLEAITTLDPINSCTNFEAKMSKLLKQTLNFPDVGLICIGIHNFSVDRMFLRKQSEQRTRELCNSIRFIRNLAQLRV